MNSKDGLQVQEGNIFLASDLSGIVMRSPDGHCWKLLMNKNGQLVSSQIDCPE